MILQSYQVNKQVNKMQNAKIQFQDLKFEFANLFSQIYDTSAIDSNNILFWIKIMNARTTES